MTEVPSTDVPTFSIVTISFNQAEFVKRTIRSVLTQTDVAVQYIVCDPGSTDGSRAIIERYRGHGVECLFEPDRGPADGLNRGFARATGEIYGYLNSDDTYLPGALQTVANYFRAHPEIDVVVGHALITDRHDQVLRKVWSDPYHHVLAAHGVTEHYQPSTFFRASAFCRTPGFNPASRTSWDGELLLEMQQTGAQIAVIDRFLSTYRLHGESLTNTGADPEDNVRFQRLRFERLMARSPRLSDTAVGIVLRIWKRIRHPRRWLERLLRGPVYRRGVD